MKSLDDLFRSIMSVPWLETDLKIRAGYLRTQLCGRGMGYWCFTMFGV